MKKNIKRVMGILLAATMSISLVMPAFASQTSNTDAANAIREMPATLWPMPKTEYSSRLTALL